MVQVPQPPLQLPVVTLSKIRDVCEQMSKPIRCLLFRITEAQPGQTVAEVMAMADMTALHDPTNVSLAMAQLPLSATASMSCNTARPRQLWCR